MHYLCDVLLVNNGTTAMFATEFRVLYFSMDKGASVLSGPVPID